MEETFVKGLTIINIILAIAVYKLTTKQKGERDED